MSSTSTRAIAHKHTFHEWSRFLHLFALFRSKEVRYRHCEVSVNNLVRFRLGVISISLFESKRKKHQKAIQLQQNGRQSLVKSLGRTFPS